MGKNGKIFQKLAFLAGGILVERRRVTILGFYFFASAPGPSENPRDINRLRVARIRRPNSDDDGLSQACYHIEQYQALS
jgi:hypothetical protein